MSALLELAARVEALAHYDRDVDAEIACLIGRPLGDIDHWLHGKDVTYRPTAYGYYVAVIPEEGNPGGRTSEPFAALEFTDSIDAARRLVPKGCSWSVTDPANADGSRSVFGCPSRCHAFVEGSGEQHTYGKTAALALCAAALRAKAVGEGK